MSVDIDGTLANYHGSLIEFVDKFWDQEFSWAFGTYDGSCDMADYYNIEKEKYRIAKLAYRQGGNKRFMPLMYGAFEFMEWLSSKPVEIWLTTNRPYLRHDNIDTDTRWWLNKNDIKFHGIVYEDSGKYEQLIATVDQERILLVIDDLPERVMEADFLGLEAFQIQTAYNRAARWNGQGGGFLNARSRIIKKLDAWK